LSTGKELPTSEMSVVP